jgi:NADPH-dependent ferric siderophore reductase
MNQAQEVKRQEVKRDEFKLEGVALATNAAHMLDQICEHFVEHAEVERTGDLAVLTSKYGAARIRLREPRLLIDLACPSEAALQVARNSIAEHMFFFAGADPLELVWSRTDALAKLPNLHEVTVVGAEEITPHMRRVRLSCADVAPFVGGDMHVRILVPPRGRQPVWPGYRRDGRIAWPEGQDALLVRPYTIRAVDTDRRELWVDVFQHPDAGVATPGGDFARDARPGDVAALIGPGSGSLPKAASILLIGDESALPAIARIAAEVPAGTGMRAIVEVLDAREEQPLPSAGSLDVRWLHRRHYPAGATGVLVDEGRRAIASSGADAFIWIACEKQDVRALRSVLKQRGHDKRNVYAAWYWEKE